MIVNNMNCTLYVYYITRNELASRSLVNASRSVYAHAQLIAFGHTCTSWLIM